jgi:hypothetical protein
MRLTTSQSESELTFPLRVKTVRTGSFVLELSMVFHQVVSTKLQPANSVTPLAGTCDRSTVQPVGGFGVHTPVAVANVIAEC